MKGLNEDEVVPFVELSKNKVGFLISIYEFDFFAPAFHFQNNFILDM